MSKKTNVAPVNEIDETIKVSTSFIEKNFKTLAAAIGGVLAVIIICLVVNQYYIQPNKLKAADSIAAAQQHFQQGMYEQALNGDGTNLGFLQVIEQYGSTPSGNIARLYAGLCFAQTEKYEEAVKYLDDYDACVDQMVSNAAIAALGNCYAQLGQNEKAASTLLKAAKRANSTTLSPLFYQQAGQIYESLGNKDKALECYETIKNEYPQSMQRQDIDKYIERVK
jgi:tetratricopeptide (TPR) repeat protein